MGQTLSARLERRDSLRSAGRKSATDAYWHSDCGSVNERRGLGRAAGVGRAGRGLPCVYQLIGAAAAWPMSVADVLFQRDDPRLSGNSGRLRSCVLFQSEPLHQAPSPSAFSHLAKGVTGSRDSSLLSTHFFCNWHWREKRQCLLRPPFALVILYNSAARCRLLLSVLPRPF